MSAPIGVDYDASGRKVQRRNAENLPLSGGWVLPRAVSLIGRYVFVNENAKPLLRFKLSGAILRGKTAMPSFCPSCVASVEPTEPALPVGAKCAVSASPEEGSAPADPDSDALCPSG